MSDAIHHCDKNPATLPAYGGFLLGTTRTCWNILIGILFGPSFASHLFEHMTNIMNKGLSGVFSAESVKTASFWICFVLCASLIADLAALLAEKHLPTPPVSRLASRSRTAGSAGPVNYDVIIERNLFSSKAPKAGGEGIDLEAEPVPTLLNYQLIGTVIFKNPARSLAAIQDKGDSKLYPVRVGDQIGTQVQILSVEARKVIFINSIARRKEFIEIPEDTSIKISTASPRTPPKSAGINQVEENKFVVGRAEIDTQMGNLNTLLTQARALPENRGGQMIGFRLTQIVPNSFYQKVGFKDNDIIKSVNGEKITDPAKALELLQGLKSMSSLDMTIERGGKDINFNYDIR
jgi:type II secretion system protein C